MTDDRIIKTLEEKANIIRKHILEMIYIAGSGHVGGSLSCADILTVLYFHIMRHDPSNPKWKYRDIFILSKGHAAPALYATLAESEYFPTEELNTLRKFGSRLQGHPDAKLLPGIEISSGSLGQVLSIASGIALNAKLEKKDFKVYVLLGDGELDEGQIWEAALFGSKYKLNNLVAIIDRNRYQIDGETEDVMPLESLDEKWRSFGWDVHCCDGNDIKDLVVTFDNNVFNKSKVDKPVVIIANTVKGAGVSYMENNNSWHGKAPNKQEYDLAMKGLE